MSSPGPQAAPGDDLNNPLAVVLTNLDLLWELMPRMRDESSQYASRKGTTALNSLLEEAQRCVNDAREAAERLRAIARRMRPASVPPRPGDEVPLVGWDAVPRPARLLIVDDDEGLARALGRLFPDDHVVVQVSPLDALHRVADGERFDVIISDVVMPGMSGADLHAEIRRLAPEQAKRMLFLTGGCGDQRLRDSLDATGQPVLTKPFDAKHLRVLVERFLG